MNINLFSALTEMDLRLPIYLTSCGGWDNQERMDRRHGFPDYQWLQTISGEGHLEANDVSYTVSKGQGIFLVPNQAHLYYPVREPWEVQWISFNGELAASMLHALHLNSTQLLYLSNPNRISSIMNKVVSVMKTGDSLRSVEVSALVYEVLLDLFISGSASEVRSKQQYYEQLEPVFSYIEANYDQDISLEQLSNQLGVTPQHTCLLFKQTVGMRPFEYITLHRLRIAKELLVEQRELPVQEVAKAVGYTHTSYFIKLFKQAEGVTPNNFRCIHRVR